MKKITYEIQRHGTVWHLLRDGETACVCLTRESAIDTVASLHRRPLKEESFDHITSIGFDIQEVRSSETLNPNWRRKGPDVEFSRFEEAEWHLSKIELVGSLPPYMRYQHAMNENKFSEALDQLLVLGDLMELPPQFWQVLREISHFAYSGVDVIPNRKTRGQQQSKKEFIERRAAGDLAWRPKLDIEGWLNL